VHVQSFKSLSSKEVLSKIQAYLAVYSQVCGVHTQTSIVFIRLESYQFLLFCTYKFVQNTQKVPVIVNCTDSFLFFLKQR